MPPASASTPRQPPKPQRQATLFAAGPTLACGVQRGASPASTPSSATSTYKDRYNFSSAQSEADMSTSESSILSSAEAYARQGGEPLGIGEIVKVKLDMRFVSGGGGCLVSTLSLKREALQMASLKSKQ